MNKNEALLDVLNKYGNLFEFALNLDLSETKLNANNKSNSSNSEIENDLQESIENLDDNENYIKNLIKAIEEGIECKLLTIDILKSASSFLLKEGKI